MIRLYIYNIHTNEIFETMEAYSYDDKSVSGEFGTSYFGDELEFSSKEDLSETLRALWRRDHPTLNELMSLFISSNNDKLLN